METTLALTFIGLVPEILIEISISYFFERLDLVDRYQVRVEVHELDAYFFKSALRQQVPLHATESFVRVVVRLRVKQSGRSEWPQKRKKNEPRPRLMETSASPGRGCDGAAKH